MSNVHSKVGTSWFPIRGLFVLAFVSRQLNAQNPRAQFTGQSGDTTGTADPCGLVTLISDPITFSSTTVTTSTGGDMSVGPLPGAGTIQAEVPGFQKCRARAVEANAQQLATVDVYLTAGNVEFRSGRAGDFWF